MGLTQRIPLDQYIRRIQSSRNMLKWPYSVRPPFLLGLIERCFVVLACYLDDSGEDNEPIITLAGYLSLAPQWIEFEIEARKLFDSYGIDYLHTVDFYHRRGQFDGWGSIQKLTFAKEFYRVLASRVAYGFEFSVLKERFSERKKGKNLKQEGSPMGFCFRGILDRIVKHPGVEWISTQPGVDLSFVVEAGQKNQGDTLARFTAIKKMAPDKFGSIAFEDKKKFIALQAADFLAFYSRRIRNKTQERPRENDFEFFSGVTSAINHHHFLATDFFGEGD